MAEEEKTNEGIKDTGAGLFERRKYPRVVVDLPMDYESAGEQRRDKVVGSVMENMSMTGCLVYLSHLFDPGAKLIIEIYFSPETQFTSLKILSDVVWNNPRADASGYRHGLKYVKLEKGGTAKLKWLIDKYSFGA